MSNPSTRKPPTGKLYAIADIHVAFSYNQEAWFELAPHPGDGLILCGDIGETVEHLRQAFSIATKCFDTVWWCPGNHELYTFPTGSSTDFRGEQKYQQCVEVARSFDILTPEDDFVVWEGEGGATVIAPIFTLYDYSFKPYDVTIENAVSWAREENIEATDEFLLHPDPFPSRQEWCSHLVKKFEAKLEAAQAQFPSLPFVIANHWPLRKDLASLKYIPRFVIWCGTTLTEDWHQRFNARAVISGHLHIRRTDWKNGCRFEEVSLGYPRQWKHCAQMGLGVNDLLREVLPGPEPPENGEAPVQWRRYG
ncbi:Metallo-dependent phosphatase-like protein [Talaromyces proteolyticus]|uniref:Metallo-dependent phosphatase-like protein n=1 Tax=Talaromyces proteolyticus TaxID=1131652 RepID=A0AAD4PVC4_9EURO|nr:Metallo-dependent phosphatase-like protein [Talaromyces proteolyticus]KAH8696380.1 Metallo-dependent phosphatase-like protein [Talaromyces proteolyticus]